MLELDDSLTFFINISISDFSAYRVVFLVLGTLLITLAPTFSESLIFYYSSAMAVGIILVVLIVLFQVIISFLVCNFSFWNFYCRLLVSAISNTIFTEENYVARLYSLV